MGPLKYRLQLQSSLKVQVSDQRSLKVQVQGPGHSTRCVQVWVQGAKCRCGVQVQGKRYRKGTMYKVQGTRYKKVSSKLRWNGSVHAERASAVADLFDI